MATAGYLISRAAEQPPILSLTVAIVGVRFFGLARPLARYLERLASHDLALRALARSGSASTSGSSRSRPAQLAGYRRGDLLARMVARRRRAAEPAPARRRAAARRAPGRRAVVGVGGRVPPRRGARARGRAGASPVSRCRRWRERSSAARVAGRRPPAGTCRPSSSSCCAPRRSSSPTAPARRRSSAPARPTGRWSRLARRDAARRRRRRRAGARRRRRDGGRRPGRRDRRVGGRAARPRPDRDARAARARLVRGGPAAQRGRARAVRNARGRPPRPRADDRPPWSIPRAAGAAARAVRRRARRRARALRRRRAAARSRASACGSIRGGAWRSSARAEPGRRRSSTCSCGSSIPRRAA